MGKRNPKRETDGKVFCGFYFCAKDKKLTTCSNCEGYPCEKYDKGIFAESFIRWIREKLKDP